jgi:pyrroline-5-carboxylate reductase
MIKETIAIIGGGNMGRAIASALLDQKVVSPPRLVVSTPRVDTLQQFSEKEVRVVSDNAVAVKGSDVVFLAVKPQKMMRVLEEIAAVTDSTQLVISVAAGISMDSMKKLLGQRQPVVRVMPNLCAQIGESMSVWVKSAEVTEKQEQVVALLLGSIGEMVRLEDEDLIDAATAISGSGPAYVFYLAELLEREAIRLGLPEAVAIQLSRQTLFGSAKYLKESEQSAEALRRGVTSKGGTTEAALGMFERRNLSEIFAEGIMAAYSRSKELRSG